MTVRTLVQTATLIALSVVLWPLSAPALEPLGVYEDWGQGSIRADRWRGSQDFGGQEIKRVVTPDNNLSVRYRREGSTASNTGTSTSSAYLDMTNPTQVNEIEVTVTVTNLSVTTCAANGADAATRARPVLIAMESFNDGTQAIPRNRLGDYRAQVRAYRDGSSTDPVGMMRIQGFVDRCDNASCSTATIVAPGSILATTVAVGQAFTLRLVWDQPNHRFLFGLNAEADIVMPYGATDTAPANLPFALIDVAHSTANCTAGAVVIDSTTTVGTVRTNNSAVIP